MCGFISIFPMFFYRKKQKELFLIRDRFGVESLYYIFYNIIFASEIKAILSVIDIVHIGMDPNDISIYRPYYGVYICRDYMLYKFINEKRFDNIVSEELDSSVFVEPKGELFKDKLKDDFIEKVDKSELINKYDHKKQILEFYNNIGNKKVGFITWIWYSLAIWEAVFYNNDKEFI